jgi:hypothetical protein
MNFKNDDKTASSGAESSKSSQPAILNTYNIHRPIRALCVALSSNNYGNIR